ncbi:hypothetical protein Q2T40_13995 [Winogradskyella maritima]|uniref:DUF4384 domain-containing protein n=1 Tax=Winogradskyella maritima TaxID=1517766 RepID=A0ABV8AIA2_9FLAO|nr:hypothetical protein [Winogradskyella maritima]
MKNIAPCFLLMVCCCLSTTINAQSEFASIRKNKNFRASELFHDLNKTKDTLVLRSSKKINYAYAIDTENNSQKTEFYIDSNSFKIPLNQFGKGKHVFVAVQPPKQIVFVVNVLQESSEMKLKRLKSALQEQGTVVGTDEENDDDN